MSRSGRATRTFAASVGTTVIGTAVGLVGTPLLLHFLGDERVGVYRVAMEWVGYAALFDFGLAGSLQVLIARAAGTGDRPGIAVAVRAGARAALLTGLLGALYVGALAGAAPLLVAGLTPALVHELRIGLLFALLGFVWNPLLGFRALAEAEQRGYLVYAALAVQSVGIASLSVGFAATGFGLPGQFMAVALGQGVLWLWLTHDGLRRHPGILSPAVGPTVPLRAAFSGPLFLFQLLGRLALLSDSIIVGYILGPAVVVAFSLTQRLLLLADTQVLALGGSVWAALTELHHSGEVGPFNARLTQLTRLTAVLAFALVVPIAAFSKAFVHLWVGPERYGGALLVWWTATYVWVHCVVGLWGWPLVSTGRVRMILPSLAAATAVNVAVSVALTDQVGLAGPAIGSAVGVGLVLAWPAARLLCREFGTPLAPLVTAAVGPAVLAVPYAVALALLVAAVPPEFLPVPPWAKWAVVLVGLVSGASGYLALAWLAVLSAADRGEFLARLRTR